MGNLASQAADKAFTQGDDKTSIQSTREVLGDQARRTVWRSVLIASPLLLFFAFAFLYPMGKMLWRAFDNQEASSGLTRTGASLRDWRAGVPLPADAFESLAADIAEAKRSDRLNELATRLNLKVGGFRSLILVTGQALPDNVGRIGSVEMLSIDPRWGNLKFWRALQDTSAAITLSRILAVVDLERKIDTSLGWVPVERRIYLDYLARTIWISFCVTAICIFVGYPMSYLVAASKGGRQSLLLGLLLLSFWTSLLVRTAAWVILLQKEGIVNSTLIALGIIDQPAQLIFNRFGVCIAMTHVLLPFFVLPLYSVMKSIDPTYMRAALSLGASPVRAFFSVYLPQTVPGLKAGGVLVFVLANGFYITPALVGGAKDQMLSSLIADFAMGRANWGMASALAIVLLVCVGLVSAVFARLSPART